MKVVILAGGRGTRLSEYTKSIPKPMVKINSIPIIVHIMNHYYTYGFKDFIVAAGYKSKIIKNYFKNKLKKWNVKVVNTGLNTMTGGRVKRIKKYINNETFLLTYGDGLSTVNITKLIKFHKKNNSIITLTAVKPPARFGTVILKKNKVLQFREKSHLDVSWINGGFFVVEPSFFNYLNNDNTFLEREPLIKVAKKKLLGAYKHSGFWQCMDTVRDKEILEKKIKKIE